MTVFPVPGDGGFTDAQYRTLSEAIGNGIVNDFGGGGASAFDVVGKSSSTRDFAVRLGDVRIRGHYYPADASSRTFTVPAVASGNSRIDRFVTTLDVSVNPPTMVHEVITGPATTGTPTVPALERNPVGKWQVGHWLIQGSIGPAGSLDFTNQRVFVAPTYYTPLKSRLSEPDTSFPDGTRLLEDVTGCEWRLGYPGGVAQWANLDQPNWNSLGLAGMSPALTGRDGPPQWRVRRGDTQLQGGIARTSGNLPSAPTTLATLPVGARPPVVKRVTVASSAGWAQLELLPSGVIRLATTSPACSWINLDGISFQAGS